MSKDQDGGLSDARSSHYEIDACFGRDSPSGDIEAMMLSGGVNMIDTGSVLLFEAPMNETML